MVAPSTPVTAVQSSSDPYEARTQAIAQDLLAATTTDRTFLAQMRDQMRWDDRLLGWSMENPGLRVQLFRLIDALPTLSSKTDIARHLQDYLGSPEVELPGLLKNLLNFTQPDSMPAQLAAGTLSGAVEALAHRYIAGDSLKQVTKTLEGLRKQQMAFTLDLLGEAVITETEAQGYLDHYLDMMSQLVKASQSWPRVAALDEADGDPLPRVQVSVKLTAFYSQFDPLDPMGTQAQVSQRIRTLLRRAADLRVAVHFDIEQYAYKTLTLGILKAVLLEDEFRDRTDIGITLQAYLRDSYTDLQDLIHWAQERGSPLTIRLVKGAYWDQETIKAVQKHWPQPVFNHKAATDANFERMTQLLLEKHQYLYAAIGSHNVRSQARALAIAEALGIPQRHFEMQVLYGMADKLAKALVKTGRRVRVYCPYGELIPGMAYLIRRLLENTANSSFLRQSVTGIPDADLLNRPDPDLLTTDQPYQAHLPASIALAPDTDYSVGQQRDPFIKALETVRSQLGRTYKPLINGQWVDTPDTLLSTNPSHTIELVGKVGLVTPALVEESIQAARQAYPKWKTTPVAERAGILRRAADLLEEQRAELAAWMVYEVGKPVRQADGEISEAVDFCRYYAAEMERLGSERGRDVPGETNRYHYQPRGLAVVIAPWNFPLSIPLGMTAAALVTGNCVLLKPAEQSSVVACKLAEVLVNAGIPAGVFQCLPGVGEAIGPQLVQHPQIHMIAFTGSRQVGCSIYAEAAKWQPGQRHLKRVIAEMGGKNAIIIDSSADLDQAVKGVITSAFSYSGQKCSACSRVIVLETVYDKFLDRLVEATRSLHVGAAEDPSTQVGPVIDDEAQARILAAIAVAKTQGSRLVLQMDGPTEGSFVGPVIFGEVDPGSDLAQQEWFGPVLAVIKAASFGDALEIANNTDYGLTGGLYSRTPSHIEQARQDFAVGNLYINRDITGALVDRQPFGGFKLSGVGSKAGGPDYLLQFVEPRSITENVQRQGFAPVEGMD
jgi:RHH-type proline utilization regulon transcriptional repressor/proline dehydrogenase/delta 1-pyrroline-5-carboxylate dehydrogenase